MSSQFQMHLYLRSDRTSLNLVIVTSPREFPEHLSRTENTREKFPIPPRAPCFCKSRLIPYTHFFKLYFYLFFFIKFYTYIRAGTIMMPPRVLASGPKSCAGNHHHHHHHHHQHYYYHYHYHYHYHANQFFFTRPYYAVVLVNRRTRQQYHRHHQTSLLLFTTFSVAVATVILLFNLTLIKEPCSPRRGLLFLVYFRVP